MSNIKRPLKHHELIWKIERMRSRALAEAQAYTEVIDILHKSVKVDPVKQPPESE